LPDINVNNPDWAHQNKDVNILEWAHSHRQIVLPINLNGPTEGEMLIFLGGPIAIADIKVGNPEWAHQIKDVDILEWAHSHC
jgi:hypothetical protein